MCTAASQCSSGRLAPKPRRQLAFQEFAPRAHPRLGLVCAGGRARRDTARILLILTRRALPGGPRQGTLRTACWQLELKLHVCHGHHLPRPHPHLGRRCGVHAMLLVSLHQHGFVSARDLSISQSDASKACTMTLTVAVNFCEILTDANKP